MTAERWVCVENVANYLKAARDAEHPCIVVRKVQARGIGQVWKLGLSKIDEQARLKGAQEAGGGNQSRR